MTSRTRPGELPGQPKRYLTPLCCANPYRTPELTTGLVGKDSKGTPRIAIWWLAYLYPVWLAGSFYVLWLIAWAHLGHRPRPMLDDPKSIGGLMDVAYFVPGLFLMAMPFLAPLGLVASFIIPGRAARSRRLALGTLLAALYIGLCTITIWTLRADPGRIVEWWFD